MRKMFLLLILAAQGAIGQNQSFDIQEFYPIEASHSYVSFSVIYMGYAKVQGNFSDFNGTLRYDPEDITKTSVSFSIKTESINTNLEWRDKDLKSANWFDAERFPAITFESKSTKQRGKMISITGDLTAKDVTKEITLELMSSGLLADNRGDAQVIFSGSYVVDRAAFGIAGERWSKLREGIAGVGNEVTVEFSMLGKQIKKENFANWVRNEKRPPGRLYASYKKGRVEEVFQEYDKLKEEIEVNSGALNTVGYYLLKLGLFQDAIAILERNRSNFPEESNVYDSLGEAYATSGDLATAKSHYTTALEKDPRNFNAKEILRHLK